MKRHIALVLVVLSVGFAPQVASTRAGSQSVSGIPLVFTHVTVIDTARAAALTDQTLVIDGDRITDVGPSKTVNVPDPAKAVDASGKFLIPGLWDMHVHVFKHSPRSINEWFFPLFLANGVTGVRDMWTTADDFSQVVQWRKAVADGSFLGPRFGAVGWLVDGPKPVRPYSDVVTTPQESALDPFPWTV